MARSAVLGRCRSFGLRPGLLLAGTGLLAAGQLPGAAVDLPAGSLAILEDARVGMTNAVAID